MATEPSESEPTFTPPGSVAPVQDLPEDIIIRTDPAEPVREAWADQQDQPIEVEIETADLLGIEEERGEGAAVGAPVAAEPVVEGPVNYNIFHGDESPPRIIEAKSEQQSGSLGAAASSPSLSLNWTNLSIKTSRSTTTPQRRNRKRIKTPLRRCCLWRTRGRGGGSIRTCSTSRCSRREEWNVYQTESICETFPHWWISGSPAVGKSLYPTSL